MNVLPHSETEFDKSAIEEAYKNFIENKSFPCIAAKASMAKHQATLMVAGHIACPHYDNAILQFLYEFVDTYRSSKEFYHSAAIVFPSRGIMNEETFDLFLWQRLQAISDLDSERYHYDRRVQMDPLSDNFSFSIKEEAFFVIGLHPASSRPARQFMYSTLVFNPHQQFEHLRSSGKYEKMKQAIRKKDIAIAGSVNPMLRDHGEASEVYQYSGRQYDSQWQCPLQVKHQSYANNTTA